MRRRTAHPQLGFSLLEVLVAFVIMAMALGVLYRSLGGSVRAVSEADRHVRAVLTAESLLALHESVPESGLDGEGATDDGFAWRVSSAPYAVDEVSEAPVQLHRVAVEVRWEERGGTRAFRLVSLRPAETAIE